MKKPPRPLGDLSRADGACDARTQLVHGNAQTELPYVCVGIAGLHGIAVPERREAHVAADSQVIAQPQELRGDRGGQKEKKKPKAQKPAKGQKTRESLVTSTVSKSSTTERSGKESGSDEK